MVVVRRRAWWYLVVVSGLVALFGLGDVIGGAAVDPGIALGLTGQTQSELEGESALAYRMFDFTTRTQGWNLTFVGFLFLAILLIPYRLGRRWAWWAGWALPAWSFGIAAIYLVYGLAPDQPLPPPLVSGPILGAIAVCVLLVDQRRFLGTSSLATGTTAEVPSWTAG